MSNRDGSSDPTPRDSSAAPDPSAISPPTDPAHNPHDTYVKRVLSSPEAAGVELRFLLPAPLVEHLDWATLRVLPVSFVDPSLAKHETDILYAIDLSSTGRPVFVYVLLEHQSTLDRMMAWRFYGYLCCIWERWQKDQSGPLTALPLIVPLLMYQGPEGWTAPRRLSELFDLPPELAASLSFPVDLVFDIDDLRQTVIDDQHARDLPYANVEVMRIMLLLVRAPNPDDPAIQARIMALGPLIRVLNKKALHTLIRYITSALPPSSPLRDRILGLISQEKRTMYLSVYDEMRAEGRIESQRNNLLKVLAHRNLVLDEPLRARVLACTNVAQLERWFDRALAATTLADVFIEP